jgi:hypothetical protein
LNVFESFEVKEQISPIALAEHEMKKRQKARNKKESSNKKKSDW